MAETLECIYKDRKQPHPLMVNDYIYIFLENHSRYMTHIIMFVSENEYQWYNETGRTTYFLY
jgi:hypothetical protein